jgi:hypothetical protein
MDRTVRAACLFVGLLILMDSGRLSAAPPDADWLADVRASATLQWVEGSGRSPSYAVPMGPPGESPLLPVPQAGTKPGRPSLLLYLDLQGKAAAQASAYGDLELEPVRGESGQLLNGRGWFLEGAVPSQDELVPIDRREGIIRRIDAPKDGARIAIKIKSPPPAQSISDLRGSIALRTGGRIETIVLSDKLTDSGKQVREDAKSDARTPIGIPPPPTIFGMDPSTEPVKRQVKNETLKRLGITVELAYQDRKAEPPITRTADGVTVVSIFARPAHEIMIHAEWGETPVTSFEVVDASGKPLQETFWSGSQLESQCLLTLGYSDKVPDDARVRVVVHRDSEIVRVPFALKDLKIPPVPPMPEGPPTVGLPQPSFVPQPIGPLIDAPPLKTPPTITPP